MGLKLPLTLHIEKLDSGKWIYNLREQPSRNPRIGDQIAIINPYNKPQEHAAELIQVFEDREKLVDALEYCIKYLPTEKQEKYDEIYTLLKSLGSTI